MPLSFLGNVHCIYFCKCTHSIKVFTVINYRIYLYMAWSFCVQLILDHIIPCWGQIGISYLTLGRAKLWESAKIEFSVDQFRNKRGPISTTQSCFGQFLPKTAQHRPNWPWRYWGQFGLWSQFGSFHFTVYPPTGARSSLFFWLSLPDMFSPTLG